jgi:hypothetical protein
VKSLGADVVIDYKTQDFEDVLRDYDVVLNSQDGKTLEKSLRVLKRGGKLISISGPPIPISRKEIGSSWILRHLMRLLSHRIRKKAKRLRVSYSFHFMRGQWRSVYARSVAHRFRDHSAGRRIGSFLSSRPTTPWFTSRADRAKGKVVIRVQMRGALPADCRTCSLLANRSTNARTLADESAPTETLHGFRRNVVATAAGPGSGARRRDQLRPNSQGSTERPAPGARLRARRAWHREKWQACTFTDSCSGLVAA